MNALPLLVVPFVLAAAPPDKSLPTATWVGKIVVVKQLGTQFVRVDAPDPAAKSVALNSLEYRVLADRNDLVQVKTTQGITGWVSKSNVLLVDDAVPFFSQKIQQNANDADAFSRRAWCWKLKGEQDAAIKDFTESLRLRPNAANFSNRGIAYHVKKDYDKAMQDYSQAIRMSPNMPGVYNNRGILWSNKKNYVQAINDYSTAIRLDPNFVTAYRNRGIAHLARKTYDPAIADFTKVLARDPKSTLSYYDRGRSYVGKKDYDAAVADFDQTIKLDANYTNAYWQRGLAWKNKKDDDKAIADFGETIRRAPKFAPVCMERGLAWSRKKDYEKALADFNQALKIDPKSAAFCNSVAWLLATCPNEKIRDGKRALELATQAVNDSKRLPLYLDTLAAAHAETGNFDEAVRVQEEALRDARLMADAAAKGRLELYRKKEAYRQKE